MSGIEEKVDRYEVDLEQAALHQLN